MDITMSFLLYLSLLCILQLISEDLHINPESDSAHFMTILIQCLALLEKVPEATEVGRDR